MRLKSSFILLERIDSMVSKFCGINFVQSNEILVDIPLRNLLTGIIGFLHSRRPNIHMLELSVLVTDPEFHDAILLVERGRFRPHTQHSTFGLFETRE